MLPPDVVPAADPHGPPPEPGEHAWLEPYPDHLLEGIASREDDPDAVVVAKETIELAFLAAIQHLAPKQRAVLIMRDVLGWSANETAELLDDSVAAVKSALQRARATMKRHLPERRLDWGPASDPSAEERAVLERYMRALESDDNGPLAAVLREDVRVSYAPLGLWGSAPRGRPGGRDRRLQRSRAADRVRPGAHALTDAAPGAVSVWIGAATIGYRWRSTCA